MAKAASSIRPKTKLLDDDKVYVAILALYQTTRFGIWPKSKAFADDKLTVAQMMIFFFFDGVENIVGKGENACGQHFLLFPLILVRPSLRH